MFKRHLNSYKNAWNGIVWAFKSQLNFKIHSVFVITVTGLALYFRIGWEKYIILVMIFTMVIAAELFNTSLEATTDAHKLIKKTSEEDRLIGVAKDVAAGAVLVTAVGAVIVGLIIFLPYIFK